MFDHEKLDVYRLSIDFTAWAYQRAKLLSGPDRHARDQLLRASQSIPLNIAEGNGKRSGSDRARFLQIALGSTFECAAILDVLLACEVFTSAQCGEGKKLLQRIAGMLMRLVARVEGVREEAPPYDDG